MCYSAVVVDQWRRFTRETGVRLDMMEFHQLYLRDMEKHPLAMRIPRGFDLELKDPQGPEGQALADLIEQRRKARLSGFETEMFNLRRRLADAERKLAVKPTKAASESQRIAQNKLKQVERNLNLLRSDSPEKGDYRAFPFSAVPVIVMREGQKVFTPARYHLRQSGRPAAIDRQREGLYNARRDNLTRFWRKQFGVSHCILPVMSFYENVQGPDGKNLVMHFTPEGNQLMWVAGLCAEWVDPQTGEKLFSCAAITDEPPPEIKEAGHDRVVINLNPDRAEEWLTPSGRADAELQALLDDRQQPYYAHQIAA